ncbi:MAG TPA: ABC transporter substrate-binding protein [Burkholderiales bacterium]|nr:ABC transporter substrate-binding protein [Burkholderiales bacterium]
MIRKYLKRASAVMIAFLIHATCAQAENGVTADTITLGQSAPFSGPAEEHGLDFRRGMELYFYHINDQGGVNGRKIALESLDDGFEPNRAVANTTKLIEEKKVFSLIGYVGTSSSVAALRVSTAAKVPFVAALTGAEALREPVNRYVFNVRASDFQEIDGIVQQLTSIGMNKIAVFYQDDADGAASLAGVKAALKRRKLDVAALGTVERNTLKVDNAVASINKVSPNAVIIIASYKSSAEFIRRMKASGSAAQFMNLSSVGGKALSTELGELGRGVGVAQVVPLPWNTGVPVVSEYQKRMIEISSRDFTFTGLEGFIAAKVMVEGLKRAGKDLTREKFIAAMETMKGFDVGGVRVTYSPEDHRGSMFVEMTILSKDGKFVR